MKKLSLTENIIKALNESTNLSNIQGLEHYSENEIKQLTTEYIKQALIDANENPDDLNILSMNIYGSRKRGTAKEDSDLDIVFEYEGDFREDDLFNLLNDTEEPLMFEDIKVDLNPICAEKSGDMDSFMRISNKYDKEILDKKNESKKLSEGIQDERLANSIKWLKNTGYEEYKTGDKYTLLINTTKYDGQVVGAMFYGKSAKPQWHYRFRDMEELDNYADKFLSNREANEKSDAERREKRKLTKDHDIKVGDIFYTSWGYDQTNIDYYEVVAIRGSRIDMKELHQKYVGHDGQDDLVEPATGENRFKDDKIYTVSARADGTVTQLSSFEYPRKWDGKPDRQTDAYSGH